MEGELGTVLWHMLAGATLLFGSGIFPALFIIKILDPLSNTFRKVMLLPAISLLVVFGVAGWMVVITGKFDSATLMLLLIIANCIAALFHWKRDVIRVRRLSQWELMEERADLIESEGELPKSIETESLNEDTTELEEDIEKKKKLAIDLASSRSWWLPLALATAALLSLLPLLLFEYPNGVDWIGFSTLSHRLATSGDLSLLAIS